MWNRMGCFIDRFRERWHLKLTSVETSDENNGRSV